MVPTLAGFASFAASIGSRLGLHRRRGLTACAGLLLATAVSAQTPVVMPNTITTIAGNTPTATTVGAACPTNPQFTATTTIGDGCPSVNVTMTGTERSMVVDPQGNIYIINDTSAQNVRRFDARTGNVSIFAGFNPNGGTCSATTGVTVEGTAYIQTDKTGDGCPVAQSGGFNGGRGMGITPYGNLILTVTGDNALHFICNAVSPLCTAAQVKVNLMRNIAGCTPTATSYGTSVAGTTVGTAGDGTQATQFSGTCTVGTNSPRQAASDRWENVYIADNSNQRIRVILGVPSITVNSVTIPNPLYAALAISTTAPLNYSTPTQGFIYPIAGGGVACSSKTDAGGDGCPFYQTVTATSSQVQGLAVDNDGDFIFADGLGRLRTIYMGGTAIKSALAANGITSPQIGYSYALVGNGLGSSGATGGTNLYYNTSSLGYNLGSAVSLQAGSTQRVAIDPVGNIYIGDQAQILFYDIYTGYIHRFGGATTATSCNSTTIGEGCPVTQALIGAANSVLSLGFDNIGNLYIQDLQNKLIRRVSASLLPTSAVNGTLSSKIVVHAPVAASSIAVTAASSPDFIVGAPTCPTASTDGSNECSAIVTYAPKALAQRTDPISVATTVGANTTTVNTLLAANSTGSALVFDTANAPGTVNLGASATGNTTVLVDGAGNQYVSGTQGISKITGSTVTNITATVPNYFAVDPAGNVYTASGNATSITKYSYSAATGAYTSSTVAIPLVPINGTSTQGSTGPFVVDAFGEIYIADTINKQVIKFSQTAGVGQQVSQTALTGPTSMAQDTYGNLLIIDGTSLIELPAAGLLVSTTSPLANPTVTFLTSLVAPTAVAADQGGNIYVADSGNIIALSFTGFQYTIPGISGTGLAVDGAGNLYTAKSSVAGVTQVLRNAESKDFGVDVSTPYVGVFSNAGATASTGFNQTDTGGNYSFLAPSSPLSATGPTCSLASTALAAGALCNVSAKFAPTSTGTGPTPDVITLLPAVNTIGSLSLTGTKNGSTATTTTAITGNVTGLIYTTGTETTFTITVTQSVGTPTGVVGVQIDGGTAVNYPLTGATATTATATVPVSALSATTHNILATYAGGPGIAGSTALTVNFSIGQASTSVSWTPTTTTQPFSTAIGTAVLNATATVPGVFVYTATPSGGSPMEIHSASYLPIGTYSLAVTFYPTDAVDYTGNTGSVATYTVTKASTTAPVGASQFVVAADGTGNYSTVQAAVNAVGLNGGSVYIKPGTYNGLITVVQPNVALRGLGGDPTKVILTHSAGSFGNGQVQNQYAGEFNTSQSNGFQLPAGSTLNQGDEASATLVVAKGVNTAFSTSTLTPNNFYGENFSLINTYNTDTNTTTTTYNSGGACVTNAGPARTYNDLFNAGIQCASQALAIWITSDLAVMNNVYTASLQDTIYAGSQGSGSNGYVPSREYWFRGKVTGTVDYIFGDAAAVFDHSSIYTVPHGTGIAGTATIEAQNKANQTGSGGDYLSGYIANSVAFTSQQSGMTGLEFGRPYGIYSTWIMLNSYIDQVAPAGYIPFGPPALDLATYDEYNNIPYTDPATGSPDVNGVIYLGLGGSSGQGVSGPRETVSQSPGTPMANNAIKTSMTQAQAQAYYPTNFLGTNVSSLLSTTQKWNPTAALATAVNAFVPSTSVTSVAYGSPITVLMRPQTPGLGAVTYGVYTIPTGTYTLKDGTTTVASGTLDAAGEAYFSSSTLAPGTHNFSWTYSGDANFSGSTTASALAVTVAAIPTTTTLAPFSQTITYGQSVQLTATVASTGNSYTPTGNVTLTIDGGATQTLALSGGQAVFSVAGLVTGGHTFSAAYAGDGTAAASSTAGNSIATVNKASLVVTGTGVNRPYGTANILSATVLSYQNGDTAATVFSTPPSATTTATRTSPVGSYQVLPTATLSAFGSANYALNFAAGSFNVTGGVPQRITFSSLPNFAHGGAYQLTARASSGLPVTYTITTGGSIASISGSTLTVTGTGPVTVLATQTDPTTDYATATLSRSFVAQ